MATQFLNCLGIGGTERAHWRALNDVVLHKGGFARVVTMRVEANGEVVARYSADGVVLATPTGSTAYNLSAGGPVVFPTLETILVTAVSAHTLAIRPLVLPPTSEVTVQAVFLGLDNASNPDGAGQEMTIPAGEWASSTPPTSRRCTDVLVTHTMRRDALTLCPLVCL